MRKSFSPKDHDTFPLEMGVAFETEKDDKDLPLLTQQWVVKKRSGSPDIPEHSCGSSSMRGCRGGNDYVYVDLYLTSYVTEGQEHLSKGTETPFSR